MADKYRVTLQGSDFNICECTTLTAKRRTAGLEKRRVSESCMSCTTSMKVRP